MDEVSATCGRRHRGQEVQVLKTSRRCLISLGSDSVRAPPERGVQTQTLQVRASYVITSINSNRGPFENKSS